jgi:hypothetical protein
MDCVLMAFLTTMLFSPSTGSVFESAWSSSRFLVGYLPLTVVVRDSWSSEFGFSTCFCLVVMLGPALEQAPGLSMMLEAVGWWAVLTSFVIERRPGGMLEVGWSAD